MQILPNLCNRIAYYFAYKEVCLSSRSMRVMAMLIDKRELYIGKNAFPINFFWYIECIAISVFVGECFELFIKKYDRCKNFCLLILVLYMVFVRWFMI